MDRLAIAFREIRSLRDCEAVRNLLLDCWQIAAERGEEEGLRHAEILRASIGEFVAHERHLASLTTGASGAVLGARPFPVAGEWWGLLDDGDVVPATDRRAARAVYWCDSAAGWYRVPNTEAGRAT